MIASKPSRVLLTGALMAAPMIISGFGCIGASSDPDSGSAARRQFPLDTLPTASISVDRHDIQVWLARGPAEREEGLMWVDETEIADDQGMLFIFPDEAYRGFWMKNTVTPLDIAFARMNGTIVATHQMPPLTLQTYPSIEPAMFALEMKAGAFERLGITAGDRLTLPQDIFKNVR